MIHCKVKVCLLALVMAVFAYADTGEGRLFPKSDKITLQKVSFKNQYDFKVAGNLFIPKNLDKSKAHPAIIVGHPMGAVKEQSASLYAFKMAEAGFVALAIDLSFWGASDGTPKNSVLPDMYVEDFSAAVDYLGTRKFVDKERIGVIGVCGSGSFAVAAAKIDPRIKAIATISMYDMGQAYRNGLNKGINLEQRKAMIAESASKRFAEFEGAKRELTGGTTHEITDDTDEIQREFYSYYRTNRGEFTPKGATKMTTTHPTLSSISKFANFYPFNDLDLIAPRPLLFISGDKAHSKEFSEDAYKKASEPKELFWVKGASHVDLYDKADLVKDKLQSFFKANLK